MPEYQPMASPLGLDEFTTAYLECAEWCGVDDEQREALELSVSPEWTVESVKKAEEDCRDFRESAGSLLNEISDAQAGHDFWLTRNHHGAGFWDRGLGKVGDTLTELAHPYGDAYVWFDSESEELNLEG